jgi:hypothetical protein
MLLKGFFWVFFNNKHNVTVKASQWATFHNKSVGRPLTMNKFFGAFLEFKLYFDEFECTSGAWKAQTICIFGVSQECQYYI